MRLQNWLAAAATGALLVTAACAGSQTPPPEKPAAGPAAMDRTVLPVQEPSRPAVTEIDARNVTPPPRFEVKAPADETADVGIDLGTPVVEAIGAEAKSRFTGRIPKVTIEVK